MSNIRRQTIVIAVLIALIACAGWFAKRFNDSTKDTNALNTKKTTTNYFVDSRMGRENQRSTIKQELDKIIKDDTQTKDARTAATTQLMQLLDRGDKENAIETKAKERGYDDALCIIDDKGVDLCVKSPEALTKEQVAQLKDDIVKTTGIAPSNIVIKEKKQ